MIEVEVVDAGEVLGVEAIIHNGRVVFTNHRIHFIPRFCSMLEKISQDWKDMEILDGFSQYTIEDEDFTIAIHARKTRKDLEMMFVFDCPMYFTWNVKQINDVYKLVFKLREAYKDFKTHKNTHKNDDLVTAS